ncbi:MAG: TonB-dependent receptor [Rhodanobacter sp.]|nr:MAG: TonB-dependent receptor [Rhodanobacter sp.]TAM07927.1 MAG: TonB-dependent receptor [Rhodanobacter sp.]TAM37571.1 MAG: TonB-dependent receptor [Rhodanobacter sp.]
MTSIRIAQIRRGLLAVASAQVLVALPSWAGAGTDPAVDAGALAADGAQSSRADGEKTPVKLKEVVVTAQRRTQKLKDVPISVSAIGEAALQARGMANVADLSSAVPNLQVSTTPGDSTAAQISIRGMAGYNPALTWDTPVGLYVDGVYIGKTQGSVFDLLDLERIEVLRGPQGTLFGRNTMAGAINLVTRPPSGDFSAMAQVGFGNYGSKVGKALVDLPAIGKLKATLGARIERRDGWVRTTPGSSTPELGNRHNEEAFAALRYDATDNLTIDYRYDHSKTSQYPLFNQAVYSQVGELFGIPGIIVNPDRQTTASVNAPEFERVRIDGNALTVNWKLGGAGTLKYIGAHREMHWDDALDLDGSPIALAQTQRLSRYRQNSHELQYLGSAGPWNWVAGLYYFGDKGYTENPQSFFFGSAIYTSNYGFDTRAHAAYGQVDYRLGERWTFTAGLRRTDETKDISRFLVANGAVVIPFGTHASKAFGDTTVTLNAAYKLGDNHMLYARYAEGYMSGGFNGEAQDPVSAVTPYLPEKQKTFEVGSKSTFFGGQASLNAALFYNRIDELQEPVFTAQGSAGSAVLNVGKAHAEGVELEAQWHPTPDFTLHANYGYLHTKYDRFMELGVNVADNRAVVHAPRHTASLVATDTFLRTGNGSLTGTLEYRFTSGFYAYPYQLRLADPTQQVAANSHIGSQAMVNGRLAFSGMNWGHGLDGEVALWVKNLTNVAHVSNVIDFGPGFANLRVANFDQPRTFGIDVTARW